MRISRNILNIIFCLGLTGNVFAQGVETVNSIEISSTPTKSYIVNEKGRLLPGFSFKATTSSIFSIKANSQVASGSLLWGNYVRTETIFSPTSNEADIDNLLLNQKSTAYSYVDGLSRPIQQIGVQSSPSKNDVVTFQDYDFFGNEPKQYLAYTTASNSGAIRANPSTEQQTFYQSPPASVVSDLEPYKLTVFDDSPSNTIKELYKPGFDWHPNAANKSVKISTRYNIAGEVVELAFNSGDFPYNKGTFAANTLIVTESIDEAQKITRSYKNFQDQLIMMRVGDGSIWADTYYIYDFAGNLTYVFPPEAISQIADYYAQSSTNKQAFLDRLTFQYQYDGELRLIAKRVPGTVEGVAGWTYLIYDQWNRVVLTQDPVQRTSNQYSFVKYDRFNRAILTGLYATSLALPDLRTNANASAVRFETEASTATGYTLTASYPTDLLESNLLTVNYYDNYSFVSNSGWDAEGNGYGFSNISGFPQDTDLPPSVKGSLTGSKVRVMDGSNKWLNSAVYYDRKYRVVQTIKENFKGGVIRTANNYLLGKLEKEQVYSSFSSLTILKSFTYDHAGRLLTTSQTIDTSPPVILASTKYNELGQLIEKNVHSTDGGTTFLQSIDLKYNIQGWNTSINNSALNAETGDQNSDLFGMEYQFNPTTVSSINNGAFTTKKWYNGNVSSVRWKTDTKQGTTNEQTYGFDFDIYSRLTKAYYATNNGGVWNGNGGMFDEQVKSYDKNGNIQGILRSGNVQGTKTTIDDLTLSYNLNGKNGNRLIAVDDTNGNTLGFKPAATSITEEYQYDNNGNLKFDFNKGISQIDYNHLNLPTSVQFTRADGTVDKIEYTYDAAGNKLKKVIKVNGSQVWWTDFVGIFQYEKDQLSFFSNPEGRTVKNSGVFENEYYFTDHLGNTRLVYGSFKDVVNYRATMEVPPGSSLGADEEAMFNNVALTRSTPPDPTLNYTPSSTKVLTPNRSARCNGFTGKPIGPAKSLRVLSGDLVYMEAYAKYLNVAINNNQIINNLVSVVTASYPISDPGEAATFSQQLSANLPGVSAGITKTANVPKAYLVWLFFDDNYVYQRAGAVAITTSAYKSFEKLSRSFTADKNGKLFIYVANEDNESAALDVYFDELSIVHQKTTSSLQVTQASDFYPFGLSYNQYCKDKLNNNTGTFTTTLQNRRLFQGQELQKDLDLNLYQFEARMLDPAIGRFASIDPLSERYFDHTPYSFAINNPICFVDPDGRVVNRVYQPYINPSFFKQFAYDYVPKSYFTAPPPDLGPVAAAERNYYNEWMNHLQGDYKPATVSYSEEWASGEQGYLKQALSIASSLNPLSDVAHSILEARNGNYETAAYKFGSAAVGIWGFIEEGYARSAKILAEGQANLRETERIIAINRRLDEHLQYAVNNYSLSAKQIAAGAKYPNLEKAYIGSAIDKTFKAEVLGDEYLRAQGGVSVTPLFKRGPDVYTNGNYWDVTTPPQWDAHRVKYDADFGNGMPLFYQFSGSTPSVVPR